MIYRIGRPRHVQVAISRLRQLSPGASWLMGYHPTNGRVAEHLTWLGRIMFCQETTIEGKWIR